MKLRKMTPGLGALPLVVFLLTVVSFGETLVEAATLKVPGSYATIQEAIDAASPGDSIKISSGTFTENIVVDKKLRIRGKSKTRIVAADNGEPVVTIAADDVELKRLDIRGGFYGVLADSVNKPKLLSLRTSGAIAHGIYLLRTGDALLSKCRSYDNGINGIFLQSISPGAVTSIKKCRVYRNRAGIISLGGSADLRIESCRVYENNFGGIVLFGTHGATILKNRCRENHIGILVESGTSDCRVEGNTLSDNVFAGLLVRDTQGVAGNNVAKNNRIGFLAAFSEQDPYDTSGIFTSEWVFENNTAQGNSDAGFGIRSTVALTRNKAIDNQGVGFSLQEEGPPSQAIDNVASDNAGHGFLIENISDSSTLTGNRSISNGGDGFHANASATNTTFTDNEADRNTGFGFVDEGTNDFVGNTCGGNNGAGESSPVGLCE